MEWWSGGRIDGRTVDMVRNHVGQGHLLPWSGLTRVTQGKKSLEPPRTMVAGEHHRAGREG